MSKPTNPKKVCPRCLTEIVHTRDRLHLRDDSWSGSRDEPGWRAFPTELLNDLCGACAEQAVIALAEFQREDPKEGGKPMKRPSTEQHRRSLIGIAAATFVALCLMVTAVWFRWVGAAYTTDLERCLVVAADLADQYAADAISGCIEAHR